MVQRVWVIQWDVMMDLLLDQMMDHLLVEMRGLLLDLRMVMRLD